MANFIDKGKLCRACLLTLETPCNRHYKEYKDFVASKDAGCFLCTWLWERHRPPPPPLGHQDGEKKDTITISCLTVRGWDLYHAHFSIECDWAPITELKISLRKEASNPNSKHPTSNYGQPWDDLDPNIGSNQSLQKIQDWIASCQENHEHCRSFHSETEGFFPARIIDVTNAASSIISVKNRDEVATRQEKEKGSQRGPCSNLSSTCHAPTQNYPVYWTLSHRWGNPNVIKQLLKSTESRLREGIFLEELSPTFRDAILLVYRMGYRYIWIDSLCIFQDSRSDWHREVGSLVDIYRHSFCNISAISSSYNPVTTGLFGRRMTERRTLYPFVADIRLRDESGDVSDGSWMIRNKSIWDYEIESAPLSRRGWVVQERFLARRLVHFTRNQIYWECLECTHCEAEPKARLLVLDREVVNQTGNWNYAYPKLTMARLRINPTASLPRGLYDSFTHKSWRAIVAKYTSCYLTVESDKLAAISGVAKTFRDFNGERYLAGLWDKKLYLHLLWRIDPDHLDIARRNRYAPSWSWASITGSNVEFVDIGKEYYSLVTFVDARIVTEPPGGDPTGLLRSAELDIECALCSFLQLKERMEIYNDETGETRSIPDGMIFPDTNADKGVLAGACIPICEWRSPAARFTYILLLKQKSGNIFERIGIKSVRWSTPMLPMFEKWASKTSRVTLI